ncbi:23S rRNA (pseudouridine(1915)-N(3))-methyltransferase RlmH [cf. Phormidesmis sp. LEGE 11477]|uniref:23S rRNA (pseudouridine(1915)-N(3))-methyltransferase RlmH n=1 Tax=cf. Phormidesmis sp. LEGE 11477 TaxID=1828680 RepID=UPI0018819A55|nr:23S rRNA (pseudouridine(1915)-N(3))-methyltransferase RlmH [cf. Phormidesmis sp. LEGE 11477]MBE9061819.1 23S rRNA (pseudouridine(1915)-N(3))-methyltransferase RlmH [cf. Phormidesmis sp. LEGE 11477]
MGQSFPKVKIIAVGKVKKSWLKEGITLYAKRLPEVEIVEIKDSNKEKEANKLLSMISAQDRLVVMTEYGKAYDSLTFAQWLGQEAFGSLVLFIGGPEGVCDRLKKYPMVSLSAMTFPHEIARLLLLEQLYRAKTILNNGSYHK